MTGRLFDRGATLYSVTVDDELLDALKVIGPFKPNVDKLDSLVRFRVGLKTGFPLYDTAFGSGLFLMYHLYKTSGQRSIARTLLGIYHLIEKNYVQAFSHNPSLVNSSVRDDFVRQSLNRVSKWAFPRVFSSGPAYMLLMHLETLGSKSPWTRETVWADIDKWVSGEDEGDFTALRPYIDNIFDQWSYGTNPNDYLTFEQFCNDPMRWGTSGGAKKTKFRGEEYRSKWAWAFGRLVDVDGSVKEEVDLYAEALKEPELCIVALKEEEKKTREIITTPMASYLRQSYLAYRWNSLPGDSPLVNPEWLGDFQGTRYPWYGCADAERFDHSVSKEMIQHIVWKMGEIDESTRLVAAAEIACIDRLKISWNDRIWDYRGGLLSGWRITSIVGTLISMSIGRRIVERTGLWGAKNIGMGDDIIIASPERTITKRDLYEAYAETKFHINLTKTTAGPVGEFLRQTYSDRGVFGYPALAAGSILYAPPWLERFELATAQEISKNWITLYSRVLPHALEPTKLTKAVQRLIKANVRMVSPFRGDIDAWLATPISAGGGGVIEWSEMDRWSKMEIVEEERKKLAVDDFYTMLGIGGTSDVDPTRRVIRNIVPLNMHNIKHDSRNISRIAPEEQMSIPKNVNKTFCFLEFLSDRMTVSQLERAVKVKIPRAIRVRRRIQIIKYLMGMEKNFGAFTSAQTTNDALGHVSRFFKTVHRVAASNKRLTATKDISAVATYYACQHYNDVPFVSGTW